MRKNGFTLVEIIVYLGLLSIFLVVLLDVLVATLNMKLDTESASYISQDSRYILNKLNYDIQNADSITTPASLGLEGTSLVLVKSGVTYTYLVDADGNLTVNTGSGALPLNSNNSSVQSITFKRLGNTGGKPTIQIHYILKSLINLAGENKTQEVNVTLGLR